MKHSGQRQSATWIRRVQSKLLNFLASDWRDYQWPRLTYEGVVEGYPVNQSLLCPLLTSRKGDGENASCVDASLTWKTTPK